MSHIVEDKGLALFKRQVTELDNKYWIRLAKRKREQGTTSKDATTDNKEKSKSSTFIKQKLSTSSSNSICQTQTSLEYAGKSTTFANKLGNDGKVIASEME